jgi:ABC-type uncharacterized transport system auxiliary subunit
MKYIFLLILATGLLLPGCRGGRALTTRYYLLEYPEDVSVNSPESSATIGRSCFVNIVEVYPPFATNQIAHRENTHELSYYAFNQWAVRPEASLTRILLDFLDKYRIFEQLYTTHPSPETDYTIDTAVQRMEIVSENNDYHASIAVRFRLIDNISGEIAAEHTTRSMKEMKQRDINLFAGAISSMFVEELGTFISEINNNRE